VSSSTMSTRAIVVASSGSAPDSTVNPVAC
jgi:hypothetical protein